MHHICIGIGVQEAFGMALFFRMEWHGYGHGHCGVT
jgi:hypothetical protein